MNPALHFERTSREYIIITLSLFSAVAIFPFIVHRLIIEDWFMAGLDTLLMSASAIIFVYTLKTRKIEYPSLALATLFVIGELATVTVKGPSQIFWAFPCTVGIYYLVSLPRAIAMNMFVILAFFILLQRSMPGIELAAFTLALVATNSFTIVFAVRNQIQKKQLEKLTLKDPLTGANNRRAFEYYLAEVNLQGEREHREQSIMLLDIDDFKAVNDEHGHLTGDEVLSRMVTLVQTQLHTEEKIYRIGGDEFAIAPLKMSLENTCAFANRIGKIIQHSNLNENLGVTVSIGVATLKPDETANDWAQRADHAMYSAKRDGKNKTSISGCSEADSSAPKD